MPPAAPAREAFRERLIAAHLHLVPMTRQRLFARLPAHLDPEDLEGWGYRALVQAADRFDPARGVKFRSFAITMVKGAMHEWLRREDWVPRSERDKLKRGLPATIHTLISLDHDWATAEWELDPLRLAEYLADEGPGPAEAAVERDGAAALERLLGWLPEREELVLRLYFWEGLTLKEIGRRLGCCESRAMQIKDEALARLRGWIRPEQGRFSPEMLHD